MSAADQSIAPDLKSGLQRRIGYRFKDIALLQRALTHRSAAATHMERLEFLGDAVLGLVIAEYLHREFPEVDEGSLSRMRASVVRREGLLLVADAWSLQELVEVGEGERSSSGIKSRSILANAVEAIIGAVFTDAGWDDARRLVMHAWEPLLAEVADADLRDAKSRLQEWTQGKGWGLPEYQVTDFGVGQKPRFQARCSVRGKPAGSGTGERKKLAEIKAAEQAWKRLKGKQDKKSA